MVGLEQMASSGQANGDDFPLRLVGRPTEGSADLERLGLADANLTFGPMNTSDVKLNGPGYHNASWQARWKSRYSMSIYECRNHFN
jgi:hypothetical protein